MEVATASPREGNNVRSKVLQTPYYLLEEVKLRQNLQLIRDIAEKAGVEFILAFKAFALWKTFPIFREYISHTTASSPYEARLALEEFGSRAHTYSPAYEEHTFGEILHCSSHITFNSLSQFERFAPLAMAEGEPPSLGLRINLEHSRIETLLYDPCAPGSRFGITADQLASFDETASAWVVAEGEYQFLVAASAADVKATLTAPVKNQQVKAHDVLKPQTKMNLLKR